MKTDIERIALSLPAGFAERAPVIARLLAQALAESSLGAGRYGIVDAGRVHIDARDSDSVIARSIAAAVAAALHAALHAGAAPMEDASCSRR